MRKISFLIIVLTAIFAFTSCNPWQPVFNGENLDNFDKYIGTAVQGHDDLLQTATTDKVFQIVEENGEVLIHISGEVNGSLATKETFENYHLQLVFKWGDKVYNTRNSGLLYHSFGEFGDALGTWMTNIECQLMHEKLGDTYLMNNTYCETAVAQDEDRLAYSPTGEVKKFGKDFEGPGIKKAVDAENDLGQWNTVDLYSVGRTTVHVVNGKVTMVNTNTGIVENGKVLPLTGGKIQLQSEGADLFIKTIQVKPLTEIPADLLK